MKQLAILFLLFFVSKTFSQDLNKGLGLRYADSNTLAKQSFLVPPRSFQGPVIRKKVDLSGDFPPILSQGGIGSCASWATAYAMRSYYEKKKIGYIYLSLDGTLNQNTVFSPLFIFNQVKEGGLRCDSVGSQISSNLEKMKQIGVCKLGTFNPVPYRYPCCEVSPLANDMAVTEAANFKIKDYGWVIRYGAFYGPGYKLAVLKNFLLKNYPVVLGIDLDSSFYKTGGQLENKTYIWRRSDYNYVGSHAVVCVGFNDTIGAIQIYNSWGTDWGNKGMGYISYDLLESKVQEAYVINPGSDVITVSGSSVISVGSATPDSIHQKDIATKFSDKNFFITNRYQPYNNIRIMPVDINSSQQFVVFKVYEVKDNIPYEMDVFVLRPHESYAFESSGVQYDFTLQQIKRLNGLFSKHAAYYYLKANQ
jgi:hypothetical protein